MATKRDEGDTPEDRAGAEPKRRLGEMAPKGKIGGVARDKIGGVARDKIGGVAHDKIGGVAHDKIGGVAHDKIGGQVKKEASEVRRRKISEYGK